MNLTFPGRLIFGVSAVLFGVIALLWHDADTWQALTEFWKLPFGAIVGACLMAAQIAGGILILIPRASRPGSLLLGIVYALFSLACIPGIIASPKVFAQYDGLFEQFCLLCGAIAVHAMTETNAGRLAALGRTARIGLGLCAVSFTLAQVFYFRFTASLVPAWIPPNQTFWATLTTIAFALAAVAILINLQARLALRLMALMIGLFGLLVWVPLLVAHPQAHLNWSEFALNFLIAGAAWVVADAPPGLARGVHLGAGTRL